MIKLKTIYENISNVIRLPTPIELGRSIHNNLPLKKGIHDNDDMYSYEQYITEQARNECIMTINMAKASSQNLYSYLPRIDSSSTESEIFDFWAAKK